MSQQEEHSDNSDFSRYLFKRGRRCSKDSKRLRLPMGVAFGLILICLGVAFMLNNLGLIYIEDVLRFSPCALIVMGLVRLLNRGFFNIWGQILVIGGFLLQIAVLRCDVAVHLWWPVLLIWIGILVVIKAFIPKKERPKVQVVPPNEHQWHQGDVYIEASSVVEHEDGEERP